MKNAKVTKPAQKKPTLLSVADRLNEIGVEAADLGLPIESLNPVRQAVQRAIEDLPVRWEDVADGRACYFVLSGDQWWPAYAGVENEGPGLYCGWLNYSIRYKDGSVETGVAKRGRWAHCCADDTVNYHWLDAYEAPPADIVAWADGELAKGNDLGSVPGEIDMAGPGPERQIGPDHGDCRECLQEGRLWQGLCEDCQD